MKLKKLREEVLEANLELARQNLVVMTMGNASGRDRETGLVVIKPSGVKYERLKLNDLVVVDLSGKIIEGTLKPSVDTLSHLIIYRSRPDFGGIVHTHSPYATSFALLGGKLPVYLTAHADEFGVEIPVTRYASAALSAVGNEVVRTVGKADIPAVLVKNHGVFTFGKTASAALKSAVMLEYIAKTCHLALLRGNPPAMPKSEVAKWYKRYHEVYGQR